MDASRLKRFAARCVIPCALGLAWNASAQTISAPPAAPATEPPPSSLLPAGTVESRPPAENASGVVRVLLPPPDPYDWRRHFRIGMLVGFNLKADFTVRGTFGISPTPGNYNDGQGDYVIASGNAFGTTANWGYNNAGAVHYDASAHTLTFQQTTGYAPVGDVSHSESDSAELGFELGYGGVIHDWGWTRLGWEFGFGLLPITISDPGSWSASVSGNTLQFDTGGVNLGSPPPVSYQGAAGAGPAIPATPISVTPLTGGAPLAVAGYRKLDATLYTFRLGPTLYRDLNRRLGVAMGAGPALGFVTGDLKFNETVGGASSSGEMGGSSVLFGGYVNAMLFYHAQDGGDVYLGVQYLPLGGADFGNEQRRAHLDLNGQIYVTVGVNWPF